MFTPSTHLSLSQIIQICRGNPAVKKSGRKRGKLRPGARRIIKYFGIDENTGREVAITEHRKGLCVTDGEVDIVLSEDLDVDGISKNDAIRLLSEGREARKLIEPKRVRYADPATYSMSAADLLPGAKITLDQYMYNKEVGTAIQNKYLRELAGLREQDVRQIFQDAMTLTYARQAKSGKKQRTIKEWNDEIENNYAEARRDFANSDETELERLKTPIKMTADQPGGIVLVDTQDLDRFAFGGWGGDIWRLATTTKYNTIPDINKNIQQALLLCFYDFLMDEIRMDLFSQNKSVQNAAKEKEKIIENAVKLLPAGTKLEPDRIRKGKGGKDVVIPSPGYSISDVNKISVHIPGGDIRPYFNRMVVELDREKARRELQRAGAGTIPRRSERLKDSEETATVVSQIPTQSESQEIAEIREKIRLEKCPTCWAEPKRPCRSFVTGEPVQAHEERIAAGVREYKKQQMIKMPAVK